MERNQNTSYAPRWVRAALSQAQEKTQIRLDASEVLSLERELTAQKVEIIAEFGPLKAEKLAPLQTDTPPWAETISYPLLTDVGRSKVVANNASDIPIIGVELDDNESPVVTVAAAYEMTWIQMLTPENISRINRKLVATVNANKREVDRVCMIGFPGANLGGFLNNPSVPTFTLPNAGWQVATVAQILVDLRAWEEFVIATSGEGGDSGDMYPNVLALPGAEFARLTDNAGTGTDTSIWNLFRLNSQGVQGGFIEWSIERTVFAEDVVAGERRGTMYHRSAEVLVCEVPLDFEERPPQEKGLSVEVIVVSRTGGTIWKMPAFGAYSDVS